MPEINEIRVGTEIGKKNQRGKFIYLPCSMCGQPRWVTVVRTKKSTFKNLCDENGCQQRNRALNKNSKDPLYWDGKSPLVPGMKFSAVDLRRIGQDYGEGNFKYTSMLVWNECPHCKKKYWREFSRKRFSCLCDDCVRIENGLNRVKDKSGRWSNDGRHIEKKTGYVNVQLQRDDPLYCMCRKGGRVYEHRLVYAEYLGRPLKRWEVIHHKGTKYPRGSFEDKCDNRLENLEYCASQANHNVYNTIQRQINELKEENRILKEENLILKKLVC
jgi:hypothetical protein